MVLENRNIFKFKNFNPIYRFIRRFNLKSFNYNKNVISYTKFFELKKLPNILEKIYKQALHKKIMMLYEALGWEEPTDATKTIERFF